MPSRSCILNTGELQPSLLSHCSFITDATPAPARAMIIGWGFWHHHHHSFPDITWVYDERIQSRRTKYVKVSQEFGLLVFLCVHVEDQKEGFPTRGISIPTTRAQASRYKDELKTLGPAFSLLHTICPLVLLMVICIEARSRQRCGSHV